MDEHAAVNVDHCAGDVGGEVGGEEQVNVSDVLRVAEPVEGNSLDDVGLHLGRELSTGNVRLDEAWGHAVDADAIGSEFAGHGLSEAKDTGLGGGVVGPTEDSAAALGGDGGHAGDRALFARSHMR